MPGAVKATRDSQYMQKVAARSLMQMLYPVRDRLADMFGDLRSRFVRAAAPPPARPLGDIFEIPESKASRRARESAAAAAQSAREAADRASAMKGLRDMLDVKALPAPRPGDDVVAARQALLQNLREMREAAHNRELDALPQRPEWQAFPPASDATVQSLIGPDTITRPEDDPRLARALSTVLTERIDPTTGKKSKAFSDRLHQTLYPHLAPPNQPWFADAGATLDDRLRMLFANYDKFDPKDRLRLIQDMKVRGDAARRAFLALPPEWQTSLNTRGDIMGFPTWSDVTLENWNRWLDEHPELDYLRNPH